MFRAKYFEPRIKTIDHTKYIVPTVEFTVNNTTVAIKIPAGVEEGMQLKVSGKGNDSNNPNGISGDLLVLIEESQDDLFTRDGKHLHYDLYISLSGVPTNSQTLVY